MMKESVRSLQLSKRVLSLKKAVLIAFLFGIFIPAAIMRFDHKESFNYLLSDDYIISVLISILVVFTIVFLSFFKRHRCPNCSQNLSYEYHNSYVLDRDVYEIDINLIGTRIVFSSESHLQESACSACAYEKSKRIKRRFIELEKVKNEGI